MPRSVPDSLDGAHPSMLRVGIEPTSAVRDPTPQHETDPRTVGIEQEQQKFAELRRDIGHSIGRALQVLGMSKQEAAYQMHYRRDPSVVSRWCSGSERPLFDRLFALPGFEEAWLLVRAAKHPRMDVVTEIRVKGLP